MTERPRELGDFKGVGHFGAKFSVELRVTFRANIYGPLGIGEWLLPYYNFAAGSSHTKKNFVADFIRLNLNCI